VAGSIADGYNADLAVVNADLGHLPAGEICQAEVTQTWVRGQVVYSQG
jgi:predicted amidohydrolase YtcJ